MPTRKTRSELHQLVWARPVTKVAAKLGVSDVALHKICRNHNIPVPPRGHWAKLTAGKPVKITPLPKTNRRSLEVVEIIGSPTQKLPESVLEAQRQAKTQEAGKDQTRLGESSAAISPHIDRLRKKLESAKPKKDGYVRILAKNQFNIGVTPATRERAKLALENIINAAMARGYKLAPSETGLALQILGEPIALAISETIKREAHEPTATETARLERWERAYDRKIQRGEWASNWDKPEIPEFDEVPNGQLLIELDQSHSWDGLRRRFRDGKRQRIENLSEKIVTAAATCAAAAIERREESVRRKRENEEFERRRQEFDRQRILEEKRWEFFESKLQILQKAQLLERFVLDYEANYDTEVLPGTFQQLLRWATLRAAAIRSEVSPDNLALILEKHDLMNDNANISSWVRVDA